MNKTIKITVLKADVDEKPKAQYAIPDLGSCPFHQRGQVLYTDGIHKPEEMCDYAWESVKIIAAPLARGELVQPRGTWLQDDHVGVAGCLDGIRPVTFLLEACQA